MKIEVEKSYLSEWAELPGVIEEITTLAKTVGLPKDDVESFSIALWEALANAVKHGNRGRQGSRLYLKYGIEPGRLWALVRDEGEGFDSSRLPGPPEESGPPHTGGQGIFLMRSLCDRVEWSRGGTEVLLVKLCSVERRSD